MRDLLRSGVAGQAAALRDGRVGAVELTEAVRAAVEELNSRVNAFFEVSAESALREAAVPDECPAGSRGALHGVPVAIEQENDIAGSVTTFGGRANHTPAAADSGIVGRLRRAGAVISGKATMPEFGLWPFTEAEATGRTGNPWNAGHTAGGSSVVRLPPSPPQWWRQPSAETAVGRSGFPLRVAASSVSSRSGGGSARRRIRIAGSHRVCCPAGSARSGLPIGVQLVGRFHDDPAIMALAGQVERALTWADHWPPS